MEWRFLLANLTKSTLLSFLISLFNFYFLIFKFLILTHIYGKTNHSLFYSFYNIMFLYKIRQIIIIFLLIFVYVTEQVHRFDLLLIIITLCFVPLSNRCEISQSTPIQTLCSQSHIVWF